MTPLRIGIVGARFAAELHAVNYRPLVPSAVVLAAVCARTRAEAEAREWASGFPVHGAPPAGGAPASRHAQPVLVARERMAARPGMA